MYFPPSDDSWFSAERVDYVNKVLQALVYLLAVPYLLYHLAAHPAQVLRGATAKTAGVA